MTYTGRVDVILVVLLLLVLVMFTYRLQLYQRGNNIHISVITRQKIRKHGISLSTQKKFEIQQQFEDRRLHLEKECKRLHDGDHLNLTSLDVARSKNHMILVPEESMMFCASKKSGSTFLRRIAQSLASFNLTSDPFLSDVPRAWSNPLHNTTDLDDIKRELMTTTNVLFVRDPYSRLYSAWLDKFYSPNPFYWYNPVTMTIEVADDNNVPGVKCGTQVSFQEFIDGVFHTYMTNGLTDVHFLPSHKPCLVCQVNYQYVAKFEDYFNELLNVLTVNKITKRINTDDMANKADIQTLEDGVSWTLRVANKTSRCFTLKEGLQRFWKRLIARGILDKRSRFPLHNMSEEVVRSISHQEITDMTLESYKEYDQEGRHGNRDESMAAAFNNLPENSYKNIIHMFDADFRLFGYDKNRRFRYDGDYKYF